MSFFSGSPPPQTGGFPFRFPLKLSHMGTNSKKDTPGPLVGHSTLCQLLPFLNMESMAPLGSCPPPPFGFPWTRGRQGPVDHTPTTRIGSHREELLEDHRLRALLQVHTGPGGLSPPLLPDRAKSKPKLRKWACIEIEVSMYKPNLDLGFNHGGPQVLVDVPPSKAVKQIHPICRMLPIRRSDPVYSTGTHHQSRYSVLCGASGGMAGPRYASRIPRFGTWGSQTGGSTSFWIEI